jgi:hypothetical protein
VLGAFEVSVRDGAEGDDWHGLDLVPLIVSLFVGRQQYPKEAGIWRRRPRLTD